MEKIECQHCGFDNLKRPVETVHIYWCPKCGTLHFANTADNSIRYETPEDFELVHEIPTVGI